MKAKKRGEGEEEEEKKKKKKKKKQEEQSKGMDTSKDFYDFWYEFYMESKKLMVLYGFLGIFMSSKPRV